MRCSSAGIVDLGAESSFRFMHGAWPKLQSIAAMKPASSGTSLCPPSGEAPHFDNVHASTRGRERQETASVPCAFVLCACIDPCVTAGSCCGSAWCTAQCENDGRCAQEVRRRTLSATRFSPPARMARQRMAVMIKQTPEGYRR